MRSATLWRDKLSLLLGLMKGNKLSSPAGIYSETDYRDLVRRESRRSERSGHLCWILLVYRTNAQGLVVSMGPELADKTISALSGTARATDHVGWYRQGQVLGVLLTTLQPDSAGDGCEKLKCRLLDRLRGALTLTDGCSLQIRMIEQDELSVLYAVPHPEPFLGSND
jgi:hypothetical protein